MPNVLQILSSNYSGESVNITFTPLIGDVQNFDNVSLPYNFINDNFDGNYSLFFPDYNLTYKFEVPYNPPQSKCRCTEFSNKSFLGKSYKISYKSCNGSLRNVSLLSGQNFRDCVLINQITANTSVDINLYGYCNSVSDCQTLTQPPTPTPTRTPTPTISLTPTQTPTGTPTPTPSISNGTLNQCYCISITNLSSSATTALYYTCQNYFFGSIILIQPIGPQQTKKVCGIYNSISGSNISVSYENGLCLNIGDSIKCPEIVPSSTPVPTCSRIVLFLRIINNCGNSNPLCSPIGYEIWKYDLSTLEKTLLFTNDGFTDRYLRSYDIAYTFDTSTNTGKVWVLGLYIEYNENIVIEHDIVNSNYSILNVNRTITISDMVLEKGLDVYNSSKLISTSFSSFVLIDINNEGDITLTPEIINNLPMPIGTSQIEDLVVTSYNSLILSSGNGGTVIPTNDLWEINLNTNQATYVGNSPAPYNNLVSGNITSLFLYNGGLYGIIFGSNLDGSKTFKYDSSSGNTTIWSTLVDDNFEFNGVVGAASNILCNTNTNSIL
jgi:hypothetical protein